MKAAAVSRREQIRAMLADLKMPGALEAVDGVLSEADSGAVTTAEAIEKLLGAQIGLRNNRRLQAAMRSSRLPRGRHDSQEFQIWQAHKTSGRPLQLIALAGAAGVVIFAPRILRRDLLRVGLPPSALGFRPMGLVPAPQPHHLRTTPDDCKAYGPWPGRKHKH